MRGRKRGASGPHKKTRRKTRGLKSSCPKSGGSTDRAIFSPVRWGSSTLFKEQRKVTKSGAMGEVRHPSGLEDGAFISDRTKRKKLKGNRVKRRKAWDEVGILPLKWREHTRSAERKAQKIWRRRGRARREESYLHQRKKRGFNEI